MSSRVPSSIRWTKHKTIEELLDDPLAEGLYGLFLKVKDSPRHISIKPEILINEVYRICNSIYQEDNPKDCLEQYAHEIELDLGWKYAVDLVMSMAYVVLKVQKRNPKRIEDTLECIQAIYHTNIYWDQFYLMACSKAPQKKKSIHVNVVEAAIQQYKKQVANVFGKDGYAINLTINLNNEIKGNIDHLHLAHADVAVGVAEAGSNVFHHKVNDNGRE